MPPAPEIAVVAYHLRAGRVTNWVVGGYGVPETYIDAIRRGGGLATPVLPGDRRAPVELLERFGGLLLVGGGDVEPRRFGQEPHGTLYGLEPDRDELRSTCSMRPMRSTCRPCASAAACR